MVRDEGMDIFVRYGTDGVWRVTTNESDEVFARTSKANLHRPYGPGIEWKVKLNMLGEEGMEPVPDLQVIPLNEDETLHRKARSTEHAVGVFFHGTRACECINVPEEAWGPCKWRSREYDMRT